MDVSQEPPMANISVTEAILSSHTPTAHGRKHTTDEYLWIYVSPVILLLGLCGNFLILLVINRKNLRGTTTCVYLTALAIFDTLALVSGIIPEWVIAFGFYQFSSIHDFTCQLEKFIFYTTSDTAIWILVIFTLDRFVAVCFPLYKRSVCVVKRARIACAVVFVLAFVKNFHVFFTRGLEPVMPPTPFESTNSTLRPTTTETPAVLICDKRPEFKYFESMVRPWIAFALVSVLPFTILVICNAMIIWVLAQVSRTEVKTLEAQNQPKSRSHNARRANESLRHPSQVAGHSQPKASNSTDLSQRKEKTSTLNSHTGKSSQTTKKSSPSSQSYKQTTMMCLSASITFLICVFPSIVMLIGKPYWWRHSDGSNNFVYDVCKAINNQLAYLNHSINFFLYCITGRKFRTELVAMFKSWCRCCGRCRFCGCCRHLRCCRICEEKGSYQPNNSSITGKWKGKLSSLFVSSVSTSVTELNAVSCDQNVSGRLDVPREIISLEERAEGKINQV